MKKFKIERLVDKAPVLYHKLKQWCYEINGFAKRYIVD